jgi:class 3 adenylate cyclase
MEPRIQYVKTKDDVSIAYYAIGDGPALVCHPPLVWSHLQLEWQNPELRTWYERLAETRMLIRYDFRGLGLSERNVNDLANEAHLQDLEAVVNRLQLESFALWSVGPGTPRAITYAVQHPERVSHLIFWRPQMKIPSVPTQLVDLMQKDWLTYSETLAHTLLGWSEGRLAHERAGFIRASIDQSDWIELSKHFAEIDATELLPKVSVPTLILASQQASQGAPGVPAASDIASRMRDAHVVFLEGADPTLWVGDPGPALRAINDFLGEGGEPSVERERLPEGTAIILFLDIAGSTALTTKLGDSAYREKERELDASLRAAISDAGGTPVEGKVLGDGIMAVFSSARQAINAAQRCRDLGNEAGLPLHLGIHAGDVVREGNNVHGGAVQLASRVQGAAAPGEILVSATVRDLARTSAGVAFEDRGEHELKGIAEPQRLFAVQEQG